MLRTLSCLAAALLALSGSVLAAELEPDEIAHQLVGKQIAWWEEAGWRHGYLMFLPNGAAEMTVDRPSRQHDVGRWAQRGNAICTQWGAAREGREKCYRVSRGPDGLFVTTGGNVFQVRELGV